MTQKEINILNFENELMVQKRRLNDLIYENSTSQNSMLMNDKIVSMENTIKHMETQLQMLKAEVNKTSYVPKEPLMSTIKSREYSSANQYNPQQNPFPQAEPFSQPRKKEKKNFENIIGNNVMNIAASILIFIGLIIFCTSIIKFMPDVVKLAFMYLVSITTISIGVITSNSRKGNKFFMSLMGFGEGLLFITILMSNLYFHYFDEIVTYAMLFVWTIAILCLSHFIKDKVDDSSITMLKIIGQVGVTISVLMGCAFCLTSPNLGMFMFLTIYTSMAMIAFNVGSGKVIWRDYDPEYTFICRRKYECKTHIFCIINEWILLCGYMLYTALNSDLSFNGYNFVTLFIIFITLVADIFIAFTEDKETDKTSLFYHITMGIYAAICIAIILQLGAIEISEILICYAICFTLIILVEIKEYAKKNFAIVPLTIMAMILFLSYDTNISILHAILITIPLLIYGVGPYMRKSDARYEIYSTMGIISLYAILGFGLQSFSVQNIFTVILCSVVYFYLRNHAGSKDVRVLGYPAILLMIGIIAGDTLKQLGDFASRMLYDERSVFGSISIDYATQYLFSIGLFVSLGLTHIIATVKNIFKTDTEKKMGYIINAIIMIIGLYVVNRNRWELIVIPTLIGVFVINSKKIIESAKHKTRAEAYVAIKYSILLIAILSSYSIPKPLMSIILLIFAGLSIGIGFKKDKKGYRLYGLALSMIVVFKLLMIDISVNNQVLKAFSLILCGGICFGISYMYNVADKKLKEKQ